MKIRYGVPAPEGRRAKARKKYFHHTLKIGQSLWFSTEGETRSFCASFSQWNKRANTEMTVMSRRVADADPDGPGYRVWVVERPKEAGEDA